MAAAPLPQRRPGAERPLFGAKTGVRLGHGRPCRARALARLQEAAGAAAAEAQTSWAEERPRHRRRGSRRRPGPAGLCGRPAPQPLLQPGQSSAAGGGRPSASGSGPGGRGCIGSALLAGGTEPRQRGQPRSTLSHCPQLVPSALSHCTELSAITFCPQPLSDAALALPRLPQGSAGLGLPLSSGCGSPAHPDRGLFAARGAEDHSGNVIARAVFKVISPLLPLCCALCCSFLQFLEPSGEEKPPGRAEPAESSDVLDLSQVWNGTRC